MSSHDFSFSSLASGIFVGWIPGIGSLIMIIVILKTSEKFVTKEKLKEGDIEFLIGLPLGHLIWIPLLA